MPLYEFRCLKGHEFDRVLRLAAYDEPQTCSCGQPAMRLVSAAYVAPDLPDYRSPVDGRLVSGRKARRDDLARNGCVEFEPSLRGEIDKRVRTEEAQLERAIEETVEREIHEMPVRKREALIGEMEAGLTAEVQRSTPQL